MIIWTQSSYEAQGEQNGGNPTGVYLFMTIVLLPSSKRTVFIKKVRKESDALPPVIDVEFNPGCRAVQ